MTLHAEEATTLDDAGLILYFRNVGKDGFSQYNDEITPEQQAAWWHATDGKRLAWLYFNEDGIPIGFGLLLLQPDGLWTTTVAVHPHFAGQGYGKEITHDIVARCPGECRAAARKDNPAAVKCHDPEQWDVVEGPDERLVYFRTKAGVTAQ